MDKYYIVTKDLTNIIEGLTDWQLKEGRIIKYNSNMFLSSKLYEKSCDFNQLNSLETDLILLMIKHNINGLKDITNEK